MNQVKGILIPIGGNEDKGEVNEDEGIDFIEEGILSHVVKESGGPEANIIIIPTASSIPDQVGENYIEAFGKLGCTNIIVLNLTSREQCNAHYNLDLMTKAKCVMFSGGNQSRITEIIANTELHTLIATKFKTEDFVIAGTSAGAMAMANEMIAGGSSKESMLKGAVMLRKGLNLIPKLIIDTHFIRRGRFGRLAEAIATYPKLIGIGLAEDTGLVIKNCNEFKVIGSGMVIVFDAGNLTHNTHEQLEEGTPMSISNLKTHILANGDRFALSERKISVLPQHEAFV
ncbi:MAG: cyanophycinase [Bacteroidetes bacterium]|nr:MAG: cyanophycinase [Bacteroidota bacterium]